MSKRLLIVFLLLQIVIMWFAVTGQFGIAAAISPFATAAGFVAIYSRTDDGVTMNEFIIFYLAVHNESQSVKVGHCVVKQIRIDGDAIDKIQVSLDEHEPEYQHTVTGVHKA